MDKVSLIIGWIFDVKIKKYIIVSVLLFSIFVGSIAQIIKAAPDTTEEKAETTIKEPSNLYARSACLMDADTGRVLFEKDGQNQMPMASTTKIMTLIVTLEYANLEDIVTVSSLAARQPDVQLNINTGEQYYLKDLLYSLMLESHNDSAYAIAEHVGGSVEEFASMMNQKAKEIGCNNTYYITPNGLDAENEAGIHSTTAVELARIMSYCIKESPKREQFLEITRTQSHSFSDIEGKRSFSCNNHNAFLSMMEGALSGKTGFTGKAGYCYVGALERDGKTFVVALLACGWPNNKTYKWSDTKKLMTYGLEQYKTCKFEDIPIDKKKLEPIVVKNGKTKEYNSIATASLKVVEEDKTAEKGVQKEGLLLRSDEQIQVVYKVAAILEAPIKEGDVVGTVQYVVNGEVWNTKRVITENSVEKIDYKWCLEQVFASFLPILKK